MKRSFFLAAALAAQVAVIEGLAIDMQALAPTKPTSLTLAAI